MIEGVVVDGLFRAAMVLGVSLPVSGQPQHGDAHRRVNRMLVDAAGYALGPKRAHSAQQHAIDGNVHLGHRLPAGCSTSVSKASLPGARRPGAMVMYCTAAHLSVQSR